MGQTTYYEFGVFRLNLTKRILLCDGVRVQLPAKALDLLLVLIQNSGQTLSKKEIISRVWTQPSVTDNNFNVTLRSVRRALGESAQDHQYIARTSEGYRFVADVREVRDEIVEQAKAENIGELSTEKEATNKANTSQGHRQIADRFWHMVISSVLCGLFYAVALLVEVAYQFDRFGNTALKLAPFIFCWILITSVAGLALDRKLTLQDRAGGLAASVSVVLVAAAAIFGMICFFLPSSSITQATFQTYTAQAAYLKSICYFLFLAFIFLLVPFHFVATMERELQHGRYQVVFGLLTGDKRNLPPKGAIYPRFWALALILLAFAVIALVMQSHLLDNLRPAPYMNLFIQLVYLRSILYFGLGIELLVWYYQAINEIKIESLEAGHKQVI